MEDFLLLSKRNLFIEVLKFIMKGHIFRGCFDHEGGIRLEGKTILLKNMTPVCKPLFQYF